MEFEYDSEKYVQNQLNLSKFKTELTNLNMRIFNACAWNFQELFHALIHLKVMRIYVDGVLRFGIPPKFFIGILKPTRN
jgi:V-type H+-transporting ATPase subunit C